MPDTSRPLIVLGASTEDIRGLPRVRLNERYLNGVELGGGLPLLAPATASLVPSIAEYAHGIVLVGGEDVDPSRYGADRHPATEAPDPRRDDMELALVLAARQARLPVLAICRGLQVLNVALGGTLVQDIPSQRPASLAHDPRAPRDQRSHAVSITGGSRLAGVIGCTEMSVNTLHHQCIDQPGEGLRVVARSSDDIAEAAESTDPAWWAVGVQWHPEELLTTEQPWDRQLFTAFVEAARRYATRG